MNPLTSRARELRNRPTDAEKALWRQLKSKELCHLKFRRQHPLGPYIVDFVCLEKKLVIEVDGGQHSGSERDQLRDAWLRGEGYEALRFWNNDVLGNMGGVMEVIHRHCGAPSPQPPPLEGGGRRRRLALPAQTGRNLLIVALPLTALVFLTPSAAFAHVGEGEAAGFLTGLRHPWSGLDHVLAMIAVGLWGAQLGSPAIWLLPVTFPLVMSFGAMAGLLGIPLPGIEVGIAASGILLGAAVAAEARPPLPAAAALVGFFAVFHGHAHGTELPPGQSGMLYSMGFVIATGFLHALGIALGLVHRWPAGRLALRGSGAAIAAMGAFFLWRALG